MKNLKHVVVAVVAIFSFTALQAQSLVQTVGGECYWTNDDVNASSKIEASAGQRIYSISTDSIAIVVDMERGTRVLKPGSIASVAPQLITKDFLPAVAAGKKVYVPVTSNVAEQRAGAKRLSELFLQDRHWHLVATPEQADFIMEYSFSASGHDKAKLCIKDRDDNDVAWTDGKSARGDNAESAGVQSAEKLYDKYLRQTIYRASVSGWNSDLFRPAGLFLRAGVAPEFGGAFGAAGYLSASANVQFGYRVSPIFAFGIGLGAQYVRMMPNFWGYYPADDALRLSAEDYSNYHDAIIEIDNAAPRTATIPVTFNMRFNTSKKRNTMFVEIGGGWCLPLGRSFEVTAEDVDDAGYRSTATISGTTKNSGLYTSAEIGVALGDFEVGLFATWMPIFDNDDFTVTHKVWDYNGLQIHDLYRNEDYYSNYIFFGIRFSYNFTLSR